MRNDSLERLHIEPPYVAPLRAGLDRGSAIWPLLGIWLGLRLLMSLWAALVSALHPMAEAERLIALWPPAAPLWAWLERVLLLPWQRWDTGAYLAIVRQGYRTDDGTAQFHPLLAWLATPIARLGASPLLALILVSGAASLALVLVFERLARMDLAPGEARLAALLLCSAPAAFILWAPYTESLCLLWSVLCLLWARQGRWWLAGLAGALAVLTRQQGIFLMLPLAWELWEAAGRDWRRALGRWRDWLALAVPPAGLLVWLAYRAVALGDLRANYSNPQALIFSVLISPSSSKVVPVQAFLWPWQALGIALKKLLSDPNADLSIDLGMAAWFMVLVALAWPRMRASYRIYVATIVLVSFAYYTGPFYPYMGLPRHLLLAFPVFVGLAPRLRPGPARLATVGLGLVGGLFLLLQYVMTSWVP
jgi:hypothetical protein